MGSLVTLSSIPMGRWMYLLGRRSSMNDHRSAPSKDEVVRSTEPAAGWLWLAPMWPNTFSNLSQGKNNSPAKQIIPGNLSLEQKLTRSCSGSCQIQSALFLTRPVNSSKVPLDPVSREQTRETEHAHLRSMRVSRDNFQTFPAGVPGGNRVLGSLFFWKKNCNSGLNMKDTAGYLQLGWNGQW